MRSHTTLGIINKWRKREPSFFSPSKFFFLRLGDAFFLSSHSEHQASIVSWIVRAGQIAWASPRDPWHFSGLCGTLLILPYLIMSHVKETVLSACFEGTLAVTLLPPETALLGLKPHLSRWLW